MSFREKLNAVAIEPMAPRPVEVANQSLASYYSSRYDYLKLHQRSGLGGRVAGRAAQPAQCAQASCCVQVTGIPG